MRISDWSSDVCSSDLLIARLFAVGLLLRDKFTQHATSAHRASIASIASQEHRPHGHDVPIADLRLLESDRSEAHTSELQSLLRISYAVFCLIQNSTTISSRHQHQSLRCHE